MKQTVSFNWWRLPSAPTYLEGKPSPSRHAREQAEALEARRVWKPAPEAWAMLEEFRPFVGREVVVQAWDDIMFWMSDEGPWPVRARCLDVVTREDGEGRLRAYLVLENPEFVPAAAGCAQRHLLLPEGDRWRFGVHDLYEIETR